MTNILNINNVVIRNKMAAFDYDMTLVSPISESNELKTFPTSVDDWVWLYPTVTEKIKEYYKQGFMIVIFTNQSKKWKTDQIELVMKKLDLPVFVVIATKKDIYKPNIELFNDFIGDNEIDKEVSFFVGDALGRKIDFSDSDKKFAENIGIKYFSPEDIFVDKNIKFDIPEIELSNQPEIIIMMGCPGSGKSTIAKHICKNENYIHISGDVYKTSNKMKKESLKYIIQNKSIVFDATHSSVKKRKELIDYIISYNQNGNGNYKIKCIHVTTPLSISNKRNILRSDL